MAKAKKTAWELNIGVDFGGVSFGDKTARLGVTIDREKIPLDRADELFCDRRLTGTVILGHTEDDPTQKDLISDAAHKVSGTFDVKGFSCKPSNLSIGLTFGRLEVDPGELSLFAKKSGRLVVTSSEEIPEPERPASGPPAQQRLDDAEDDDGDEDFADDPLESELA